MKLRILVQYLLVHRKHAQLCKATKITTVLNSSACTSQPDYTHTWAKDFHLTLRLPSNWMPACSKLQLTRGFVCVFVGAQVYRRGEGCEWVSCEDDVSVWFTRNCFPIFKRLLKAVLFLCSLSARSLLAAQHPHWRYELEVIFLTAARKVGDQQRLDCLVGRPLNELIARAADGMFAAWLRGLMRRRRPLASTPVCSCVRVCVCVYMCLYVA